MESDEDKNSRWKMARMDNGKREEGKRDEPQIQYTVYCMRLESIKIKEVCGQREKVQ